MVDLIAKWIICFEWMFKIVALLLGCMALIAMVGGFIGVLLGLIEGRNPPPVFDPSLESKPGSPRALHNARCKHCGSDSTDGLSTVE